MALLLSQFFPQSCSGQSLFESLKDSRLQSCEVHTGSCRNSKHSCPKHNCSTQMDNCSCDLGGSGEEGCKGVGEPLHSSSTPFHHKPFSTSSLHSRSLSTSHTPSEPHPDLCYRRHDLHQRPVNFTPVRSDSSSPQTAVDHVQSPPVKQSGGTWPKVIAGASIPECTQLSFYKRPRQRMSIFDVKAFRIPEVSPQLDYMSVSQLPKHSPQSSISESSQTPPTPPARSDSFRFKHRQQNSSASDSTITTGTPPPLPAQAPHTEADLGNQLYYTDGPPGETRSVSKKSTDEQGSRHRSEKEKRRFRPKSAPALRRNVTPLHIRVPMQVLKIVPVYDLVLFHI